MESATESVIFRKRRVFCKIYAILGISAYLICEGYTKNGIKVTPIGLLFDYILYLKTAWIYALVGILGVIMQCWVCLHIEKLLQKGLLTHRKGWLLHILVSTSLINFECIYFTIYRYTPVSAFYMVGLTISTVYKYISFINTNASLRKRSKEKKITMKSKLQLKKPDAMEYPKNLTLGHLLYFMSTPSIDYDINLRPVKETVDWGRVLRLLGVLHLTIFVAVFVAKQIIGPEMDVAVVLFERTKYLQLAILLMKIVLPIEFVWYILFYYNIYHILFHLMEETSGYKKRGSYCLDWWNSENIYQFWRKWNSWFGEFITSNMFIPLIKMGIKPHWASFLIFVMSGIIHEYMVAFPLGILNGVCFLGMLVQIPLGEVTQFVERKFGVQWSNFLTAFVVIFGHTIGAFLMYRTYVKY